MNPGPLNRRSFLLASAGAAAAGLAVPGIANAAPRDKGQFLNFNVGTRTRRLLTLTGPQQTGQFGAAATDLGIPARLPNRTIMYLCGDTFTGDYVNEGRHKTPVGLRSYGPNGEVTGAVGAPDARPLIPGYQWGTTLPSDLFRIGNTMYMHVMRGPLHDTHFTELWKSNDDGETWQFGCRWAGDWARSSFQQKTYAVADDGYCYVLSSRFHRNEASELLLHRVRQDQVAVHNAYEPWGWNGSSWGWGNPASTIRRPQGWGEICFRAMEGQYAFTWFDPRDATIRLQKMALPTSNIFDVPGKTLVRNAAPELDGRGDLCTSPYGGFIMPEATFRDFRYTVSQWNDALRSYRIYIYQSTNV